MMPPPAPPNPYLSQLIAVGIFCFGLGTLCRGFAALLETLRKK